MTLKDGPWFKDRVTRMPGPFARCTYVHIASTALFLVIIFWQPIPVDVWATHEAVAQTALWALFAAGWAILFLGALVFGVRDLLGIQQMQAWINGRGLPAKLIVCRGRHRCSSSRRRQDSHPRWPRRFVCRRSARVRLRYQRQHVYWRDNATSRIWN